MTDHPWQPPDEEQQKQNLALWEFLSDIEGCKTKPFNKGTYQGTSWDPTWAIERATQLWGPMGDKWGLRNIEVVQIPGEKGATVGMMMGSEFFYPGGVIEMWVDMAYRPRDEVLKKLRTDAIKKALSGLGAASSIYKGEFDDDPHAHNSDEAGIDQRTDKEFADAAVRTLKDATTLNRVAFVEKQCRDRDLKTFYFQAVQKAAHEARVRIQAADSDQEASDRFDQ